jgi:hypothetical protein
MQIEMLNCFTCCVLNLDIFALPLISSMFGFKFT